MVPDLLANPLSIELALTHRRFWWQIDDEDEQPERWEAIAEVSGLDLCPEEHRRVGNVSLVIADLTTEQNLLDSAVLGEWALEFIAETVMDPARGTLHPELSSGISPGPPRMVILRRLFLTESWRGHGLGAALVASALRILSPNARLAACRVSPLAFISDKPDRVSAELASVRMAKMLEGVGFRCWRGVHVIDLRDPVLLEARMDVLSQWWPQPDRDEM
ncbi:hypothetical protein [Amycolatopsis thermoflava]|uniref:hypothetical protein n=1 Tax=Amycolatopsis thermoflava TaxID=84480 RepID=UPI00365DAA30